MRIEKVAILNEVTARVKDSDYCFILNYGGVDVVKIGAFRAALKGHDSRLLIVKNTFLAKAAKEKGWPDEVQAMLTGPTAIVTGKGEVTAVAKDVMDFVEGSEGRASVKGADYGRPSPRFPARISSVRRCSCSSRNLRHVWRASSPRRPRRRAARLRPRNNGRAALPRGRLNDFQRMKHGVG